MLTLSLVRHGQTTYNAESRLQGWCDSPLTRRGLAGVRTTAAHLAGHPFTAAYVSPSGRAQATAHEILAHHPFAAPVTDPDLREFSFGDFEARPEADLLAMYDPDVMVAEVLAGTFAGLPGGEAGDEFLPRVRSAFARIERRHRDGHIVVVSHGLTLLAYLIMVDPRVVAPLPNASISTVEVHPDGSRRVVTLAVDPARRSVPERVGASGSPVAAV
jgi:probable phosphoglycerate mutase